MSYTNQTPNYKLPQYVADDKPTYLGDFNKAMLDIDTNMKSIDTKATSAVATADNASTNATEALSTAQTAQTSASSAITKAENAQTVAENAQTTASNAQSTASTALSNATSAKQTAETANTNANIALNNFNKFNLSKSLLFNSNNNNIINGVNAGNDFSNSGLTLTYDTSNSIFKLYGVLQIHNPSQGSLTRTIKLLNSPFRPEKDITINTAGLTVYGENFSRNDTANLTIKTDGTIEITTWFVTDTYKDVRIFFWNTLYLLQDFEQTEINPGT